MEVNTLYTLLLLSLMTLYVNCQNSTAPSESQSSLTPEKEFEFSGSWLTDSNSRVNGIKGTGTWNVPNSDNSFSGTAQWQQGSGFSGGLSGDFGIGKDKTLTIGVGHGSSGGTSANVGIKIKFRRRRRSDSALAAAIYHQD